MSTERVTDQRTHTVYLEPSNSDKWIHRKMFTFSYHDLMYLLTWPEHLFEMLLYLAIRESNGL